MVPPAATLSIYMYVRAGSRAANSTDSHVQARTSRKTAGRSTSGQVPPPGYNPRASTTGPDSPHARHAQALNQDSKPVHLPPTPDAPSMYFSQARATGQRREPRDPLHQAQVIGA